MEGERSTRKKEQKAEATLSWDSSASTRHYVATGTNLYKGGRRRARAAHGGEGRGWRARLKEGLLIGSQPLLLPVYNHARIHVAYVHEAISSFGEKAPDLRPIWPADN